MKDYFITELKALRDEVRQFAKAYPGSERLSKLESLSDQDADFDRLFNGIAFLTAQIRQRVDDDLPEICEALLSQLSPQLLRPYPAMSVVQFTQHLNCLESQVSVPKGTVLSSKEVGPKALSCYFRTCYPIDIYPLALSEVLFSSTLQQPGCFTLRFSTTNGQTLSSLALHELPLYLAASYEQAMALYLALTQELISVRIVLPGGKAISVSLQSSYAENLLPNDGGFSPFGLLQDYFVFPEKYLFIRLCGLNLMPWENGQTEFVVEVTTNSQTAAISFVDKEHIQLFCMPVINLFKGESEPIRLDQKRREYPLIPDTNHLEEVCLYKINKVVGVHNQTQQQVAYAPMTGLERPHSDTRYYYLTERFISNCYPGTYLVVESEDDNSSESLFCDLTLHNASYPYQHMKAGDMVLTDRHLGEKVFAKTLRQPTQMLLPPRHKNYRWALIKHLSLSYKDIVDTDTLKQLLQNYCWTEDASRQAKIDAIEEVVLRPIHKFSRGVLVHGVQICLTLSESHFVGLGDAVLFGRVLHEFFKHYVGISQCVDVLLTCKPSGKEYRWTAEHGCRVKI